jgi:general secretion pathway protein D
VNAYFLYAQAASLVPGNQDYSRQRAALQARVMQTVTTSLMPPAEPDERMAFRMATEEITATEAIEGRRGIEPPRLRDPGTRRDFDLRGTSRLLWGAVGDAFGVAMGFEPDYQSENPVTFRANQVTLEEAIRILEVSTNTFIVPLSRAQALVFNDTEQKRTDNLPVVAVALPIPERISIQEAQELASGIQQTMDLRRIAVDAGRRVIFIRDQEAKVLGARKILSDLSRHRAQVAIGVELISSFRNSALSYGLSLPTLAPFVNFSDFLNNLGQAVAGFANYATFGGGATLLGMGIADASAIATLSRASADSLIRTDMVSLNGQPVTLRIGDRYPIITGRFGDPTGGENSTALTQFTDIGLTLEVTPTVHAGGEVTLNVEAEYSVLGATSNNGIPVIASRRFQGDARMQFGQWGVLAGLATTSATDTQTGIPFLAKIPLIGRLFRRNTVTRDTGQVLIVLKPELVAEPPWEEPSEPIYVGTERALALISNVVERAPAIELAPVPVAPPVIEPLDLLPPAPEAYVPPVMPPIRVIEAPLPKLPGFDFLALVLPKPPVVDEPRPRRTAAENNELGRQLIAQGRYFEAIEALTEALRQQPNLATAYNARGFTYLLLRDYGHALADLDQALRLAPDYPNAKHNREVAQREADRSRAL